MLLSLIHQTLLQRTSQQQSGLSSDTAAFSSRASKAQLIAMLFLVETMLSTSVKPDAACHTG
jgi:hypothetical protein